MIGFYYLLYMGVVERSLLVILMGLFFSILMSIAWGTAILKLIRNQPYIILTNTYLQLDPQTKSEVTEDFTITDTSNETLESKQDFVKKYDPQPIKKLNIDSTYFKKAYGYSFFIFLVMFVLFYLLLDSDNSYLTYIIINFFAFPFAKVLIDWMGFYKLRERLEKQKGSTYYFDQLKYLFDGLLFHASIYIAPFGGTFLLIRYVINKVRS